MEQVQDVSNLMVGSSLFLLGGVCLLSGSLTFLGFMVFAPMALGGLGLCMSSISRLKSMLPMSDFIREAA